MRMLLQHTHGGGSRFDPVEDSTSSVRLATAGDAWQAVHEYLKNRGLVANMPVPREALSFRDISRVDDWTGTWIVWGNGPLQAGIMTPEKEEHQDRTRELLVDWVRIPVYQDGDQPKEDDEEAAEVK